MQLEVCWPLSRDHYLTVPPPETLSPSPDATSFARRPISAQCREWLRTQPASQWFTVNAISREVLPGEGGQNRVCVMMSHWHASGRIERRKLGRVFEYRWAR